MDPEAPPAHPGLLKLPATLLEAETDYGKTMDEYVFEDGPGWNTSTPRTARDVSIFLYDYVVDKLPKPAADHYQERVAAEAGDIANTDSKVVQLLAQCMDHVDKAPDGSSFHLRGPIGAILKASRMAVDDARTLELREEAIKNWQFRLVLRHALVHLTAAAHDAATGAGPMET